MRAAILASLIAVLAAVAPSTSSAAPCAGFTDVEDTSQFCASVEWMRNRGITLGCTATQYCPDSNVTRLQMAAFVERLSKYLGSYFTDANGTFIGKAFGSAVDLVVGGRRTYWGIQEDGFPLSSSAPPIQTPFFESTDCTGPAYSNWVRPRTHVYWGRHLAMTGWATDGRKVIYFLSDLPVGEQRQMRSLMSSLGTCSGYENPPENVVPFPTPLPPTYELPPFVPPFTLH